jgi:transposase
VQSLVEARYAVYAINPRAASRYRDRHTLSGAKSDPGDAKMLAELVRTDRHNHRQVAGDTALAEGVKVLARAHQTLIWERTRATNRLRSSLREYFPAALDTFDELAHRDTLAVLTKAPTPTEAAKLTPGKIRTVLRNAGRQRNIESRADTIAAGLRAEALHAPTAVEAAHGATTRATVAIVAELNVQIAVLAGELAIHFEQHPDSDIYLSLPGIGVILGARMLGEFGDDPNRYADAKSRKNYAGTSPITRASGKRHVALARFVRNKRLADAIDQAAFCSITSSPGARAFYDARRGAGDSHHKALRSLGNRWVGILHGCLRHRTLYNENTAWAHRIDTDIKKLQIAA